ncbi:MAG: reverse transcriptase family protein, partial [Candidatus Staskawiczbacteria bacterium]|nr:reverse transcriptase family protein [Candidatus Staskawiczbacteria bacterium]
AVGLFSKISKPTRITCDTATLIDNIFSNYMGSLTCGILISDISDHLPIFSVIDFTNNKKIDKPYFYKKRLITEETITAFKTDLAQKDWVEVQSESDANQAYDRFLDIFINLYNKNIPIVDVKIHQRTLSAPWMTAGLINACKKKNLLYQRFIGLRSKIAEVDYKKYKNKLTCLIRLSKKEYYEKKIQESNGNSRIIWNTLNSVLRKENKGMNYPKFFMVEEEKFSDPLDIANKLNKFFVETGPTLLKNINAHTSSKFSYTSLVAKNSNSMFLKDVEESEVKAIILDCSSKKSEDLHEISMMTVKQVADVIAKPLAHIFNLSFRSGKFPDNLKIAKVIPLYKGGEDYLLTNYRPISILPQISKILEKLFFKRLESFVAKNNLITDSQFGFRTGRSTSMAIIETIEAITHALDQKKYAAGVFLDIKKAFDTVDHKLLLDKLERMGVRGIVLDWIKSYLERRKQYVTYNKKNSDLLDVVCGVPQGSVLGPLLFILYINDISAVSQKLKLVLFADDTNIFYSASSPEKLLDVLHREMNNIKMWFDTNKLSLNLEKTKLMLFGSHRKSVDVALHINEIPIGRVKEIRFLGLIVDEKISWKPYIQQLMAKISKSIGIIYNAKPVFNQSTLKLLYSSLILPYFNYCAEIWGNNYLSNIKPLINIQKKAIRAIHHAAYTEHTHSLFIQSGLLKIQDIVHLQTVM